MPFIAYRTVKLKAVVEYANKEDAIASYANNHEQLLNNGEIDMVPEKMPGKLYI